MEWLLFSICFLEGMHNAMWIPPTEWLWCYFPRWGKKKDKKVISTKLSLHSPDFYFQGIQWNSIILTDRLCCQCQDNKTCTFFFFIRSQGAAQIHSLRFITEEKSSEVFCHTSVAVWSSCRQVYNLQEKSSVRRYFSAPESL